MTEREKQILDVLKRNPLISQKELANILGIKRSSVAVHITNLLKKGYIKGKGYIIQETNYAVVIGGTNMDITGFVDKTLIERDSNPGRITLTPGGVGRNIAQNLVSLGISTKLVSAVGNDIFGRKIIKDCNKTGIDTTLISLLENYPSSLYISILEKSGEMKLGISDMQITEKLTVEMVAAHHHVIENASAIVVDTNLSRELLLYLAQTYKKRIILDTVSTSKTKKVIDFIGFFSMIKPNRIEAELLVGFKIDTIKQAEKAVVFLLNKGTETVIISLGKKGVIYGTSTGIKTIKLPRRSTINTTGAGDAFLATLVYGQLQKYDINKSVKLAVAASSLTVQSEHSSSPSLNEDLLLKTYQSLYP